MSAPAEPVMFPSPARVMGGVGIPASALDVLEALPTAVIVTDLEGRLVYANTEARRAYAWVAEAMTGTLVGELGGVVVDEQRASEIGAALHAGRVWQGDFELCRPDGTTVAVHVVDSGLRDEGGNLIGVVSSITDVTEHRMSLERMAREAGSVRFLLDATTLLASSLDFQECLRGLAQLAVPALADICLIDVLIDGRITRLAAAAGDAAYQPLVDELGGGYAPAPESGHPAVAAMRTGQSAMSREMSEAFLRATTRDEHHFELVTRLQFTSYISAPLIARGRTLGACTLISAWSRRPFADDDLTLAEELAQRAALVVDNARLYSERTRVVRSLQAALLPPQLPDLSPLQLAARYVAAGEGNEVGGDFYDVFALGRSGWVVAVGDVSGTGPDAAAMTGLVRHALHAAARQTRDPAVMLRVANAMLAEHSRDVEQFCSAACAVIRPGPMTRVTYASAGHPPAVVVRARGAVEHLTVPGLLLGVASDATYTTRTAALRAGDHLVLHTDGLTEARRGDGAFFGDHGLAAAVLALAGSDADTLAEKLLDTVTAFAGGELDDDLALLVVHNPG